MIRGRRWVKKFENWGDVTYGWSITRISYQRTNTPLVTIFSSFGSNSDLYVCDLSIENSKKLTSCGRKMKKHEEKQKKMKYKVSC